MKQLLRRIPGLITIYQHGSVLASVAYERWWVNPQVAYDRSHLRGEWNFVAPAEQERYGRVLAAVANHRGPGTWGEVLEVGCSEGLFTKELAARCAAVTACDVSPVALGRAAERLAAYPHVQVRQSNLLRDSIAGVFDIVFVMGVLEYIHGRRNLRRVIGKLVKTLRAGGLLVVNAQRLPPQMERTWWARWLVEGGANYADFIDGRQGLRLIRHEVYPGYVIALFQQTGKEQVVRQSWKRHVPTPVREAYRNARVGLRLLRELDISASDSLGESLSLARVVLRVRKDSLIEVSWLKGLYRLAREVERKGIGGDFVECGVYRGGSAAILGHALKPSTIARQLWLFDSFQGMPRPTEADGPSAPALEGDFVGDEENVRRLLRKVGAPLDRVKVVAGWFHETFPSVAVPRVALLHIDADWYESVRLCLERFYDAVEPGGIVVLDDYFDWPGCKAALEDFGRARGLQIEVKGGEDLPPHFHKPV
jgi:O-methyltransferase